LLINNTPTTDGHCGLRASIGSGGKRFTIATDPLLVALQRDGMSALQSTAPTGSAVIAAQDALDTLATAPTPIPVNADPSQPQWRFARLLIADDPERAAQHPDNTFSATRGQAAPNQFTVEGVTLAYYLTISYGGASHQLTYQLQPVWLISGTIDIGLRHRIAPFTYLYPTVR
jgi:hypothetical protein